MKQNLDSMTVSGFQSLERSELCQVEGGAWWLGPVLAARACAANSACRTGATMAAGWLVRKIEGLF